MISQSRAPRRLALVVGSATVLVLAYAGPAAADIPVGWSHPAPVPVMRDLMIFIGIPLLITVGIFCAIYLPGIIRGESVAPAGAHTDDQWFGGRRATAELESASTTTAGRDANEIESASDTGGASGTW